MPIDSVRAHKLKTDPVFRAEYNRKMREQERRRKELDPNYRRERSAYKNAKAVERYHSDPEYRAKRNRSTVIRTTIRLKTDELFNCKFRIRKLIASALLSKGKTKNANTEKILGCSYEEFKAYFEAKFVEGMTWENNGEWHIDHIVPLASAKTEEELYKLNHYTNLQPLWALDNLKKGAKIA